MIKRSVAYQGLAEKNKQQDGKLSVLVMKSLSFYCRSHFILNVERVV